MKKSVKLAISKNLFSISLAGALLEYGFMKQAYMYLYLHTAEKKRLLLL